MGILVDIDLTTGKATSTLAVSRNLMHQNLLHLQMALGFHGMTRPPVFGLARLKQRNLDS